MEHPSGQYPVFEATGTALRSQYSQNESRLQHVVPGAEQAAHGQPFAKKMRWTGHGMLDDVGM